MVPLFEDLRSDWLMRRYVENLKVVYSSDVIRRNFWREWENNIISMSRSHDRLIQLTDVSIKFLNSIALA